MGEPGGVEGEVWEGGYGCWWVGLFFHFIFSLAISLIRPQALVGISSLLVLSPFAFPFPKKPNANNLNSQKRTGPPPAHPPNSPSQPTRRKSPSRRAGKRSGSKPSPRRVATRACFTGSRLGSTTRLWAAAVRLTRCSSTAVRRWIRWQRLKIFENLVVAWRGDGGKSGIVGF